MVAHKNNSLAVLMGIDSDLPTMQRCIEMLKDFGIDQAVSVFCAGRKPEAAADFTPNAA